MLGGGGEGSKTSLDGCKWAENHKRPDEHKG
jgi:hypothetical protein